MRKDDNIKKAFTVWAVFVFILGMAVLGLGIWGLIELINWITTK
jgi:uncharacterized membrane protein YiaA